MALSSHISHLTGPLVQLIGRGGCSLRGELRRSRCSGENINRAAGHTSLKRWLLSSSQGTVEAGAGFKHTGGNIDMALGRSWLRRLAGVNIYSGFKTAALSDMAPANAVETPGRLNRD